MSIVALCEKGLIVDLFGDAEVAYPAEAYMCQDEVALSYGQKTLTFRSIRTRSIIKEHVVEHCKQIQLSDCGLFGAILTLRKELHVYSHTSCLFTHENVSSFCVSSFLVSFSRGSELFVQKMDVAEPTKFEQVFYFKVFKEFVVVVHRIKEGDFGFKLSIYRDNAAIGDFKLEQIEKIDVKSDGEGNFLFLVTAKYISSSYYGHDHLYFFGIENMKFREVDVLDPPLFFSFLKSKFVVCSGNQPSLVSIYDYQCSVIKSFPSGVRNRVFFNVHSNLVAFCGFENLSGNIEIYDAQTLKIVTKLKILGASLFSWSPNGSYFIVSITNYMKVDNSVTMYDYYGRKISSRHFSSLTRSEWVGEKEGFKKLERPEKLRLEEDTVYVIPSFANLTTETPKKKKVVVPAKTKKSSEPASESPGRDLEDIKKELECIQCIKEKQEKGASLSVDELNKLLREGSLVNEMKKFQAK